MALFQVPDVGLKPFVINGLFKVYGYPYTIYASSPCFWGIPLPTFVESRYISIAIPGEMKGFLWLWSHLNGITPNNSMMKELGLTYDERIRLLDIVKLFGMEKNYNVIYSFIDSIMIGITETAKILDIPDLMPVDDLTRDYRALPLVHPGVREVGLFDTLFATRYFLREEKLNPFPTIPISLKYSGGQHHILKWKTDSGLDKYYITTSKVDKDEDTTPRPVLPLTGKKNIVDLVAQARSGLPDSFLDVSYLTSNGRGAMFSQRWNIQRMNVGSEAFNMYSSTPVTLLFALLLSSVDVTLAIIDEIVRTTNNLRNVPGAPRITAEELKYSLSSARQTLYYTTQDSGASYTTTEDIGDIKAGSVIEILSGYSLRNNWDIETFDDPFFPSLPREIYNYPLPSLLKFMVGPYLLEGSPATVRSRSPYIEEIARLSPESWMRVPLLKDDRAADRDAIIYVWSYLNGITDDFSRPHYPLQYLSLLRCWNYISYFQIPLTSLFVSKYVESCFDRAPKHKDLLIYQLLKDINDKSSRDVPLSDPERQRKLDILGGLVESTARSDFELTLGVRRE